MTPPVQALTVLAVADSDSYLKWSLATLDQLPHARTHQVVVANPVTPSPAQMAAAGRADVPVLSAARLARLVRTLRPDVVLLACTGPVVASLTASRWARAADRPVLVTGLPGISIPATVRAVRFRAECDLFLLHSHREVAAFTAIAVRLGSSLRFGLGGLPFLERGPVRASVGGDDVLFAAQAKVPPERADRERILVALAATGAGVVKLRAAKDEQQTHHEAFAYPDLFDDLVDRGVLAPGSVRFASGPMRTALASARGLVTVSSTAALEAMATGVDVLVLDDFGVSEAMINTVFEGSGCLGSLTDLAAGRFAAPEPGWLDANYFHARAADDWSARLDALVVARAATGLPRPEPLERGGAGLSASRRALTTLRRRARLWTPALRLQERGLLTSPRAARGFAARLLPSALAGPGRTPRAPRPDHLNS